MICPQCTHDIPRCTHDIPRCTEHSQCTAHPLCTAQTLCRMISVSQYVDSLNKCTSFSFRGSKTFSERGATRIGTIYKKVLYREFTDATFTKEKIRSDREKHLGVLGPILRAEEGDELVVVFKNMASRKYSVHPHGLWYR